MLRSLPRASIRTYHANSTAKIAEHAQSFCRCVSVRYCFSEKNCSKPSQDGLLQFFEGSVAHAMIGCETSGVVMTNVVGV